MPEDERSPMRWIETTSRCAAPQAEASTSNNIPLQGDASNRTGNLLYAPTAITSFVPAKKSSSSDAAFASTSKAAAAVATSSALSTDVCVNEGYAQNSFSDSVNVFKRITATPRKVQTQIAKISYPYVNVEQTFHTTQRPRVPITTMVGRIHFGTETTTSKPQLSSPQSISSRSNETPPKSSNAEFNKRKNERDQEIREIAKMLNEIQNDTILFKEIGEAASAQNAVEKTASTTTVVNHNAVLKENIPQYNTPIAATLEESQAKPTATKISTTTIAATLDEIKHKPTAQTSILNTKLERSKTDINLLSMKAATTRRNRNQTREKQTTKRSKSTQLPATKSNELLPENMDRRPPAYDREVTRRFMEEQRKKRRINAANELTNRSNQADKEQIKKRLEELKKNSKKIVTKNLKNAQKRTPSSNLIEVSPSKTARLEIVLKRPVDRKIVNRNKMKKTEQTRNETKSSLETHKSNENLPQEDVPAPVPCTEAPPTKALQENQKRIGLLRKSELKDHSFSAIRDFSFDKENVAIEMMTPKIDLLRIKSKLSVPSNREDIAVATKTIIDESKNEDHNLNLEMPSARLRPRPETREITVQVQETPSLMATKFKNTAADGAETTAPSKPANSESNANAAEKLTQNVLKQKTTEKLPQAAAEEQNERTDTLPYWLKPSAVQIYPYNFIKAVRRKLEAITNPVHIQPTTSKTATQENKHTSTTFLDAHKQAETPLTSLPKRHIVDAQHKVKRNLIPAVDEDPTEDSFATHTIENKKLSDKESSKRKPSIQQPHKNVLKSQTFSDITSNFSSISLQLPASNTVSEVSSIKSECFQYTVPKEKSKIVATTSHLPARASEDDDTTVSSSIFNSPEKKLSETQAGFEFVAPRAVSPLSLERIDNLKINTKGKLNEAICSKHVTTGRGGDSLRSRRSKQKVTPLHDAQTETVSINFNRLLDDFNRSLSQVIEVNEQLKSTLDKSQQICTERINRKNSKGDSKHEADEYSSDFEAASSKLAKIKVNSEEHAIKQRAVNMEKSLQQRKKELFHITNEVKPLLSSSQTSIKSTTEKNDASNLNLNIESAENSSSNSKLTKTILSAQSFAVSTPQLLDEAPLSSSQSGDSLDKRLHNIEQLKLNLKQSILSSQEKRKKIDTDSKLTSGGDNKNPKDKNNITHEEKHLGSKDQKTKNADIVSDGNKAIPQSAKTKISIPFSKINTVDKTDSNKTDESVQRTVDMSKQTTVATVTNSLEATLNLTSSLKQTAPILKSTNLESKSISEELQYATETPSQDNKNMPHYESRHYPQNRKSNNNELDNSSSSSTTTANKSQNDEFIKSHINRDRGDFLSGSDNVNNSQPKDIPYQAVAASQPPHSGDSIQDSSTDSAAPPSYNALSSKYRTPPAKAVVAGKTKTPVDSTTTLGKEIVAIFNQSDLELSILSSQNGSLSETSLNYSSVGLYERLIKNETTKSEHLTTLLKMREKALIDRTKGQIAWLEVQKERYKAKGLLMHISAIKKKQRGILLKMEREREGIKRLLQSTTSTTTSTHSSAQPQYQTSPSRKRFERGSTIPHPSSAPPALLPLPLLPKSSRSLSSQQQKQNQQQQIIATTVHSAPIVRAKYDLESNRSLEELLRKRENDLRRRREHVERLMQWHQRLDQEEAEVLQLEHMLLNCNNVHAFPHWHDCTTTTKEQTPSTKKKELGQVSSSPVATAIKFSEQASQKNRRSATSEEKMERRLKEIDKSLRELSIMSTSNNSANATNSTTSDENSNNACDNIEFVRTTGSKLNKLWRRLTSQQVEKFESNRRYKLCKADLERLYEEAKVAVLRDFAQDEEHFIAVELLDKTATSFSSSHSQIELANTNKLTIPHLNLNFSSGQSEHEEEDPIVAGEEVMLEESAGKKTANFTYTLVPTQTLQDNYSPSAAEGNFVMHIEEELEEEVSSKPSSTSIPPNSYTSSNSTTSFDSGGSDVAVEKVEREELIQRNVQKFLALTQRFNSTQNVDGLERSLSDTQLADNGAGVKKSTKNVANTTQRNIAYYGVKTQKKPSKIVNVEIANTLSSASSIFSGSTNTLGYIESLPAQSIVENSVGRNYAVSSPFPSNQSIATNTNVHSPSFLSEVVNDIPTQSNITVISTDSANVELRTAESLPDSAVVFCQTSSETNFQPLTENSLQITYTSSTSTKTVSTAATNSAVKYSNSSATRSLSMPEVSSNVRETPSYTSASKRIFSTQHSNTADVNSTAREISAKLEEISAAVSILSHSNSLQSGANAMTSQSQQQQQQSTNLIPSVFFSPIINVQADNINAVVSSPSSYSSNFENIDTEMQSPSSCTLKSGASIRSNTLVQSSTPSLTRNLDSGATLTQSPVANRILDTYETDFEDGDETCIDDISLPQFETTIETTQEDLDQGDSDTDEDESVSLPSPPPPILCEKLVIVSSPTKNQVKKSFVDRENLPPPPPPPPPLLPTSSPLQVIASTSKEAASINKSTQQQPLTPDVINELELRRYQQIQQYEHVTAVPYMYMREIPNKPPPPYVPPAHGSPMTTIFPSEERIKDITYRRTHELYCKILKTEYTNEKGDKLPSVKEEKITNIYERIILDICREYLNEHVEVLTKSDPITFHSNLAFFNPPDRLRCIQTFVYKEVRRCLAMDKKQPKRKQVYSVYGQRAKRDHIGKIIIQEMYDEDDKWCNFHREENEVLDLIIEEMINKLVTNLSKEVLIEEGGIVEDEEEEEGEEEEIMEENADKDAQLHQQKAEKFSSLHEEESLESLCEDLATSLNFEAATSETSNIGADHFISSVQSTEKSADAPKTTKDLANFKHN